MLVVKIFTYYFLLPSFNAPPPHYLPILLPFPLLSLSLGTKISADIPNRGVES